MLMFVIPPLGLAIFVGSTFAIGPLASAVIRQAALFALLIVGTTYAFHLVVVGDAFADRLRGLSVQARHVADYGVLLAIVLGLSVTYLAVYRHATAWATVVGTIFEPAVGRTVGAGTATSGTTAPGWSGHERLNVLVLGIDTRDDDPVSQNTDTMIVLSLDPDTRTAAMLSIPRDTLVAIPGVGQGKINSAYGRARDPQRNGGELARRTVQAFLGVPVHSYVVVDFAAFRQTIDSVGGVLVDVRRPVRDEAYPTSDYGIERIELRAGPQLMDGESALEYARSRHDSNDFSRSRRQQLVILALKTRLAQGGLFRIPAVVEKVGGLLRTSFDPVNVLPLARTVLGIDTKEIHTEILLPCNAPGAEHCELTEEDAPDGYYLIPDVDKVRSLASSLFPGSGPASVR